MKIQIKKAKQKNCNFKIEVAALTSKDMELDMLRQVSSPDLNKEKRIQKMTNIDLGISTLNGLQEYTSLKQLKMNE